MTPLHWAVESGDCKSVELLLRYGADIYVENKFDKSPLEIASDKGNTDIYEMLLNAESYRMVGNGNLESEIATRTIATELNAHEQVILVQVFILYQEYIKIMLNVNSVVTLVTAKLLEISRCHI